MKHSLRMFVPLVLSAALTTACREPASVTAAAVETPSCATAFAPVDSHTEKQEQIARVQRQAQGPARPKEALERLGYLFVARARVTNDPRDYARAEAAADCLESRYPGEPGRLLLRGHVLHQQHRFPEAEAIARALVAQRTFVLGYGLLGDVLMEQGRISEAAAAYQRMSDLKPFYQSYVRAAHVRWLRGDLEGATELMQLATRSASPREPELSAWAWTRLAAYELQAGRLAAAVASAERALTFEPNYAAALFTHGRVLLAMGRRAEAIDVLRRSIQARALPEYQWTLADALRLNGADGEAARVEQQLTAQGAAADPRTLSLFLATRGMESQKALRLAEEELRERTDVFTHDAHAWALAANGRLDEATNAMQRALAEGTEDGRLFLHAAVIHHAAGRRDEAARWFARAERLRATLLPSEAAALTRHHNAVTAHPTEEN